MNLTDIYQPVADELKAVNDFINSSVKESTNDSILAMSDILLESPGKRLRPALLLLSEKAASNGNGSADADKVIMLASAVELIHMASLVHDDVIDTATVRHNKPSINARLGPDVSIVFGDFVYSKAFELIAKCANPGVFTCLSQAVHLMCEGELTQVCQRGNMAMTKEKYMTIAAKKTGSLFSACCQTAVIIGGHDHGMEMALKEFGLNFGIAFQIIDDCKDILTEERILGKHPGQDIAAGDMTLPLLNLLDVLKPTDKEEIKTILPGSVDHQSLTKIKDMFVESGALDATRKTAIGHINLARERLDELRQSDYKKSLCCLTDYVTEDFFNFAR